MVGFDSILNGAPIVLGDECDFCIAELSRAVNLIASEFKTTLHWQTIMVGRADPSVVERHR